MKIRIKPLSVNKAWQGKRFKTVDYQAYEFNLGRMLPNEYTVPNGKLELSIKVGFSSPLADVDNILKPFIDILQKKYNFNDKDIFKITVEKELVAKHREYVDWKLYEYED